MMRMQTVYACETGYTFSENLKHKHSRSSPGLVKVTFTGKAEFQRDYK